MLMKVRDLERGKLDCKINSFNFLYTWAYFDIAGAEG